MTWIGLLVIIVILGALAGGNSLGGTIRAGCGCLVVIIIIFVVIGALSGW